MVAILNTRKEMSICFRDHSEKIVKVLDTADSSSLLFIGQKGTAVYRNSRLQTEAEFQWDLCSDLQKHRSTCHKWRRASFSVTDAEYLEASGHYCVATTNRTVHFMRAAAGEQWETFRFTELPTVPTCLASSFNSMNKERNCELFIGDHKGNVHILSFSFPSTMLFSRRYSLDTQIISFKDLHLHDSYVKWKKIAKVHSDLVNKLKYISSRNLLFSSSFLDIERCLISQELSSSRTDVYCHPKGITCFDTSHRLDKVATGSKDFLIRIWNIGSCSKETANLFGHKAVVADVRFHSHKTLASICKEGEVRIWNLESSVCLHRFLLRMPLVSSPYTFGNSTLHISQHNDKRILVTLKNFSINLNMDDCKEEDYITIK